MKHSSLLAKDLLESARRDGPTSEARSRIWEQVALAPSLALVTPLAEAARTTSMAPAKASVGLFGLSASKLVVVAGALAVGVGAYVGLGAKASRSSSPHHSAVVAPRVAEATSPSSISRAAVAPAAMSEIDEPSVGSLPVAHPPSPHSAERAVHAKTAHVESSEPGQDVLMYEAQLVTQARKALVEGRPAAALDVLDLAARDSPRSLEPEELSLRIRALKLLGRQAEAVSVEETLRTRYPDHFLSR